MSQQVTATNGYLENWNGNGAGLDPLQIYELGLTPSEEVELNLTAKPATRSDSVSHLRPQMRDPL